MRRILPFLLMLVIALQSSWSAAASVCRHEAAREAVHFGHHVHADDDAKVEAGAAADADVAAASASTSATAADTPASVQMPHLDCVGCHGGLCAALLGAGDGASPMALPTGGNTPYLRAITDGLPERLIRPPHTFLA